VSSAVTTAFRSQVKFKRMELHGPSHQLADPSGLFLMRRNHLWEERGLLSCLPSRRRRTDHVPKREAPRKLSGIGNFIKMGVE